VQPKSTARLKSGFDNHANGQEKSVIRLAEIKHTKYRTGAAGYRPEMGNNPLLNVKMSPSGWAIGRFSI